MTDAQRKKRGTLIQKCVSLARGFALLLLGPVYLATFVHDGIREKRHGTKMVESFACWFEYWEKGAKVGLLVGTVMGLVLAIRLFEQLGSASIYLGALVAYWTMFNGGGVGLLFGGREEGTLTSERFDSSFVPKGTSDGSC